MMKKSLSFFSLLLFIMLLSVISFAVSVGGGRWTVGYRGDDIYSRYEHDTLPHGASTQVWNGDDWDTDRVCKPSGVVACSQQDDSYRHTRYHGHGFWHLCGKNISNCGGAYGAFD